MKSDNGTVELIVRAQQAFKGKLIGLGRFIARSTFPSNLSFRNSLATQAERYQNSEEKEKAENTCPFPPVSLPFVSRFLPCSFQYRQKVVLIGAFRYRFIQSKCK